MRGLSLVATIAMAIVLSPSAVLARDAAADAAATGGLATRGPAADSIAARNAALIRSRYPAASIARGEEGVVGFRVVLERTGRIRRCTVTQTSGFAALDTATCDLMVETAVFRRVTDAEGRHGMSQHDGRLVWTLPPASVRPAVVAAGTPNGRSEDIVCKRAPKPGSLYVMTKLCLSPSDWSRALANARAVTSWYQGMGLVP